MSPRINSSTSELVHSRKSTSKHQPPSSPEKPSRKTGLLDCSESSAPALQLQRLQQPARERSTGATTSLRPLPSASAPKVRGATVRAGDVSPQPDGREQRLGPGPQQPHFTARRRQHNAPRPVRSRLPTASACELCVASAGECRPLGSARRPWLRAR